MASAKPKAAPKATKPTAKSTAAGGSKKKPLKPLENADLDSDVVMELDGDDDENETDTRPPKPKVKKVIGPGRNEGKDASDVYQKVRN